jgi:AcrR family transcriptional regulator
MSRWEPNARGRLLEAAMELFRERGFDATTVAEIAARAGLTERTFFRHFTDKREVLFSGSAMLEELLVGQIRSAEDVDVPIDVVARALEGTGPMFAERRDFARQRQELVMAHAELRERELIKLASLGSAMAAALRDRGVSELEASLAAETGIAIFRSAFERWVTDAKKRGLEAHVREGLETLKRMASAAPASSPSRAQPRRAKTRSAR